MRKRQDVTEIQNKDAEIFDKIVEKHKNKVINTCYGFLKNKADAEDASQEVFLEVYRSFEGYRAESTLSTWIYRIAVSKSLDIIRKKNRKKRFGKLKQVFGVENQLEQLPDSRRLNPEQQITSDERSRILHQAIESLSKSQRIAITLSKMDGFNNNEISEIMEVSLSSVESLIHRAKKNLYHKLYKYFEKNL